MILNSNKLHFAIIVRNSAFIADYFYLRLFR